MSILTRLLIAVGFLVPATLVATALPAAANGAYNNADIATNALNHLGENPATGGGQCKPFVNAMVKAASGNTQNPGGYQSGWDALGDEVTSPANAVKGDIIQITPKDSNDNSAYSIYQAHMKTDGTSPPD